MDSLVEVSLIKWLEIRDNFRMNWPASLPYYYAVHLNINYPAVRDALQFKLYSAYGDFRNENFTMDSLVEVSLEKWREIREIFKQKGTAYIPHYYAVHLNINYVGVRDAFQFKLYCAYGDITNGVVATSVKGNTDVLIMPINDDTSILENAIIESNLIDWNKRICIDLLVPASVTCLQRLQPRLGLTECNIKFANTFLYERDMTPFPDNRPLPEDTYYGQVRSKHITQVNDVWPYKHEASHFYFSTLVSNGLSYALYSTKDNSLVSWVFINEYSFICHLYTVDSHRKLGCAKYLMEHLINDQLRKGNDAYGFVVHGNVKSARLFETLGFKRIEDTAWGYVKK